MSAILNAADTPAKDFVDEPRHHGDNPRSILN